MRNSVRSVLQFYVYGNFHIALGAAAITSVSLKLFEHQWLFSYSAFAFLGTLFIYNLQRLLQKSPVSAAGHRSERHQWIDDHTITVSVITIISGLMIGLVYALRLYERIPLMSFALPACIALFYAIPLIPFKGQKKSLREIPALKIFLIAFVWSYITGYLPLSDTIINQSGVNYLSEHGFMWSISVFLFIFAITVPFDIRDLDHDDKQIGSLPLLIGIKRAKILAVLGLLLASAFTFGFYFLYANSPSSLLSQTIAFFLWTVVCIPIVLFASKEKHEYYFALLTDGTLLLLFLFISVADKI